VPAHWASFSVDYRFRATTYRIEVVLVDAAGAAATIEVDGCAQPGCALVLVDDGKVHAVRLRTARAAQATASPDPAAA
jgi:cyclic beta-1,2-glucan synthetase